MHVSIQPLLTWSQDRIFAGVAQNLVLLVEWKGISQSEDFRKKSRKIVAREIELRIWLEAHVTLSECYGCTAEEGEGRSLLLKLGKVYAGQRQYVALKFTIAAMPAGKHEALWLQWQYKQPPVERIRELALQKLSHEHIHHTSILGSANCCFYVEKHLELLKTRKILEETVEMRKKNKGRAILENLRRQADQLLLLATRSGDMQLLREAELIYKQLDAEIMPWGRAAGDNESSFRR